ncbi:hypothetical protein C2G38_2254751 [Gigaspora rosea]|uniref:Uncharacterized protein n=1 Tax=Gigaspora rosea TaxID=44941 RepID=A0A397U971_9GLOM|nr:hypothetical protein C2G38_2254751 [Gigaspora rosea]
MASTQAIFYLICQQNTELQKLKKEVELKLRDVLEELELNRNSMLLQRCLKNKLIEILDNPKKKVIVDLFPIYYDELPERPPVENTLDGKLEPIAIYFYRDQHDGYNWHQQLNKNSYLINVGKNITEIKNVDINVFIMNVTLNLLSMVCQLGKSFENIYDDKTRHLFDRSNKIYEALQSSREGSDSVNKYIERIEYYLAVAKVGGIDGRIH